MRKNNIIGFATGAVLLMAVSASANNSHPKMESQNNLKSSQSEPLKVESKNQTKETPVCDGKTVTSNCEFEGIKYTAFIFHAAVPEKSHIETSTTYDEQLVGYCTLCNDGTYSPSCATGRGACSYHGGVQQWNAPEYRKVPVTTSNTVVDAAAQPEYFEKVPQ